MVPSLNRVFNKSLNIVSEIDEGRISLILLHDNIGTSAGVTDIRA